MEIKDELYDYDNFTEQATGRFGEIGEYKIISFPFDRYEIKIKLTPNNEFIEIVEVGINKDFMTQKQRLGVQSYLDANDYYRE
jgi:hypothetical protein